MSTRERWIVYPLLFLALGAALRDKFIPPSQLRARSIAAEEVVGREMTVERLRCAQLDAAGAEFLGAKTRALAVVGADGSERAGLDVMSNQAGRLVLSGRDGKPVVVAGADERGTSGAVATLAGARPQVELRSVEGNGEVAAIDAGGDSACIVKSDGQRAGLLIDLPKLGKSGWLAQVPVPRPEPKVESKPAPKAAPKPPGEALPGLPGEGPSTAPPRGP